MSENHSKTENFIAVLDKAEIEYQIYKGTLFIIDQYPPASIIQLAKKLNIPFVIGAMYCEYCNRLKFSWGFQKVAYGSEMLWACRECQYLMKE